MTFGPYAELEFDLASALRDRLVRMFGEMRSAPLLAEHVDAHVPDAQGVYELFLDDELAYIGKTDAEAGLRRRLKRHAAKIQHRLGLEPKQVSFRAIRLFVFTVMDLETQLLKDRRPVWNGGGFGSNDPGRERDTTKIKLGNFDDLYPIDINRLLTLRTRPGGTVRDALDMVRAAVPWKLRSQNKGGRSKQPHPDLLALMPTFDASAISAWAALTRIVQVLPNGWQLTALRSHAILYKEQRGYPTPLATAISG